MLNLLAHLFLDLIDDMVGVGNEKIIGGQLFPGQVLYMIVIDQLKTIFLTGQMGPLRVRTLLERWGERVIGSVDNLTGTGSRGNGHESKSDISMFAQADRGDGFGFGMPEDAEVLLHPGPVPPAVGNVLKIGLFNFINHAGSIGKVIFARGIPEFETIIEWKAEASDAGQEVDPWKKEPKHNPDESGPPTTEKKEEGEERGHQEGQGTQLAEEKGSA